MARSALGALAFVGAHSYSIYLWHETAKFWALPWFERWVGSGSLPVLRLRDRLAPSRVGGAGTETR